MKSRLTPCVDCLGGVSGVGVRVGYQHVLEKTNSRTTYLAQLSPPGRECFGLSMHAMTHQWGANVRRNTYAKPAYSRVFEC